MTQPCILVVESDIETAQQIGTWLTDAGYSDVMICPGPQGPDYTCIAGRGSSCPLSRAADLVVLDLDLVSDQVLEGTPSWQLLLHYIKDGCDVVALSESDSILRWVQHERLSIIRRPRESRDLLDAVDHFVVRHKGLPV